MMAKGAIPTIAVRLRLVIFAAMKGIMKPSAIQRIPRKHLNSGEKRIERQKITNIKCKICLASQGNIVGSGDDKATPILLKECDNHHIPLFVGQDEYITVQD